MTFDLDQALRTVAQHEGSDLHLAVGTVPMMRHDGHIMPLPGEHERFTPDELRRVLSGMLTPEQREVLDRELELDLAYSAPGIARFRVNLYWQRGSMGGAFRLI